VKRCRFLQEKRTYKPGFVSSSCDDGMAIPLGRALLRASSNLPGNTAAPCGAAPDGPSVRERVALFGLAPDGVFRAVCVATNAVSSYLAVSPLPPLSTYVEKRAAVCFLWHFPSPRNARPLAGILSCGARTFLQEPRFHDAPSGHPVRFLEETGHKVGSSSDRRSVSRFRACGLFGGVVGHPHQRHQPCDGDSGDTAKQYLTGANEGDFET
jgi:hypothetical protein